MTANIAYAKNWQIMLIPEHQASSLAESEQVSINLIVSEAISAELKQQLDRVLTHDKVFANCGRSLCGQESTQAVLKTIGQDAPEVGLVLFYGLYGVGNNVWLRATLIDPLSYEHYDAFELRLLAKDYGLDQALADHKNVFFKGAVDSGQLKSIASQMGEVISQRLQQVVKRYQFTAVLEGFTLDELAPFSTFVLSATSDTQISLMKSEKQSGALSAYLPTMVSAFSVSSSLTQSRFNQLLQLFFDDQNIDIVSEYQREQQRFLVTRIGNPYTPSVISSVVLLIAGCSLIALIVKRQVFQHQLENYAQHKSVDSWLSVYEKAKSPWFLLQKKWKNQYSYWQRLHRESAELEKQAKLFFDAGDVISAKLFISKSLNLNTDARIAKDLIKKIEDQESSQKAFSDKEQRVRNKVAKAMNSYRNNNPNKALRQAYQALDESAPEKKLKRQHKAIKRLIQKINVDFVQAHNHIELSNLNNRETCLISSLEQALIGRADKEGKLENKALPLQQIIPFHINHKGISRIGKQCKIVKQQDGFYLYDSGSTNGTFVRDERLGVSDPVRLQHGDVLRLGAKSELTAVSLAVSIDTTNSFLKLNVDEHLRQTLDLAELARAWPEYVQAMRGSFVLTQSDVVLAIHNDSNMLVVMSLADLQLSAEHTPLVRIWLGSAASIAPLIGGTENDNNVVWCNNEALYGVVPLTLPCEIRFKDHHVLIDEHVQYGRARRGNDFDSFARPRNLHD